MKPLVLCILDGCGIRKSSDGNAFKNAKKPNFDMLLKKYPHSLLKASGEAVGLPKGQMGTSEVGHMNIGSGRLMYQPLEFINKSIKDKTFFQNEEILKVINHTKQNNSKLHIMGLLSDGGVHSSIDHLLALIDMCKMNNIKEVYFHLFLDGRDVEPKSALKYLEILENKIKETGIGSIATIGGRYYGMDRDNNFDRLKLSYDNICYGKGYKYNDAKQYIEYNYGKDLTDEFLLPGIINNNPIDDNDGLIVFNFRKDRLREMLTCITNPSEYEEQAKEKDLIIRKYNNLKVVTMMPVVETVKASHAFNDADNKNILVDYLHNNNLSQLRIAETEKFAHVTFFFDGGKEIEYNDMKKILIPSPKVATYDLLPEMSAIEVTDNFVKEVEKFDVTIINLANGDMVGHTGNYEATVKAVECLDDCIGRIYKKVNELGGTLIIIADHGNCDIMWDKNHNPVTSHTTSLVPCIITDKKIKLNNGRLCDVAPTMLELLELKQPSEMTGKSLIKHNKKQNIFMIISVLIMLSLIITYSVRLVHYYKVEHPKVNITDNSLTNKLLENNELVGTGDGLYIDNNDYVFKGNPDNNYLYYSGKLFRIVKINSDKSIKLVTDDITTSLVWGYNNDYNNSYIKKHLEETFYNNLSNPDNYILETSWCIDEIDKKTDLCKNKINSKVGLLTYDEYLDAKANNSYLNIKKYWWTINTYKDNKVWYVFNEGGVNNNSNDGVNYYSYGVRPVINLKPSVNYIKGDGTINNPYIIEENTEVKVGSYLKYSNYVWEVVSVNESSIKLVMNECLKSNDECLLKEFGTNSKFNKSTYGSLGYYLNNVFYYTLDRSRIVDGTWYTGSYNAESNYDYNNIYNSNITAKIGLLNVIENNKKDTYTITPSDDDLINTIKENGTLYSSETDEELEIYPSININKEFTITTGDGTINNPFIIE